jgi:hypothetical protein
MTRYTRKISAVNMNSTAITTAILFTNKYLRACISNRNGNDSKIKVNSLCTFVLQASKQPEHPFSYTAGRICQASDPLYLAGGRFYFVSE